MAERQVGEQLSEQERDEPFEAFVRRVAPGFGELILEEFDSLARQLAEAERENGRLREALRQRFIYEARMSDSRDPEGWADSQIAALNPPDPPASPADDYANCDCNVPPMEGHGQHAPGCSIFRVPASPAEYPRALWGGDD